MKKLSSSICLLLLVFSGTSANASELSSQSIPDYYKVAPLTVTEVAPTPEEIYADYLFSDHTFTAAPVLAAVDWGTVALVGEKIIQIIQAGKPVGNVRRNAVHVLPEGLHAWEKLNGWKAPNTKVYRVTATNYLNMTVIDLRLKVSANYGGGLNGRGKYLANVNVVPTSVYVRWGFNCDVWTEHHDPVNIGTQQNSVAGLGFDIRYRYGSPLTEQIGTQDYFVSGTGEIKELQ